MVGSTELGPQEVAIQSKVVGSEVEAVAAAAAAEAETPRRRRC